MSSSAVVYYPNNTLGVSINIKDSIAVTYASPWTRTNVTALCRAATSQIFSFFNTPENPAQPSGTILFPSFDVMNMIMGIATFPANCVFRLTKYGEGATYVDSALFTLVSQDGSARTFAISSTIGLTSSSSAAATTSSSSASSATITPATSTPTGSSASGNAMPQQTGAVSSSDSSSGGMTQSTKIGLAVGIVGGVLLIIALAVLFFRRSRRKQRRTQALEHVPEQYIKSELHGKSSPLVGYYAPELPDHQHTNLQGRHPSKNDDYRYDGSTPSATEKHSVPIMEKDGSQVEVHSATSTNVHHNKGPGRYELA